MKKLLTMLFSALLVASLAMPVFAVAAAPGQDTGSSAPAKPKKEKKMKKAKVKKAKKEKKEKAASPSTN